MMAVVPFLMEQYCSSLWSGSLLTFLSVVCLAGIHEVARELENPFRNVPNELPVVTLMAEYNEALLIMHAICQITSRRLLGSTAANITRKRRRKDLPSWNEKETTMRKGWGW